MRLFLISAMKVHIENRVLIGFLGTAIVLTVLGIFSFTSTQRLINTARLLSHATRLMNNAEIVIKAVVDIETGQRGFVITGNEAFLEPYNESLKKLPGYLRSLDSLTSQNSSQQAKVVELRAFIYHQLEWSKSVIEARRKSFEIARDLVNGGEGKRTTDLIRSIVRDIQNDEREIFRKGNTLSHASLKQFQYSFVGLAGVITAIIMYLFYAINESLKARYAAENQFKSVAEEMRDLYDHAPCGYFSVDSRLLTSNMNQTLLHWLKYSRDEVIGKMEFHNLLSSENRAAFLSTFKRDFEKYKKDGYVNDLEFEFLRKDGSTFPVVVSSILLFNSQGEFDGSRTTVSDNTDRKKAEIKIKMLNQELEAFTYSVSHDLRAPLRSIAGYTQILKEDYASKMGEEGMRIAQIIIANARRMGQLIDDLLDFSRLSRKELSHVHVNMTELVQTILDELGAAEDNRQLSVNLQELKSASVDVSMIRQVWINLISNALKYSRNREITKIEISSFEKDGQICYSINDNGAGFDMQYADKLFGVFQRLHKMNEFEGTGVGLALVKTIIKRHGGYVWAEGRIGEGATFYFSLPNEEKMEI